VVEVEGLVVEVVASAVVGAVGRVVAEVERPGLGPPHPANVKAPIPSTRPTDAAGNLPAAPPIHFRNMARACQNAPLDTYCRAPGYPVPQGRWDTDVIEFLGCG